MTLSPDRCRASEAAAAQVRWAATPMRDRMRILSRFAELLCDQKDSIAAVISREAGKPQAEALSTEVLVVLDTVKYLQNHVPAFLRPEPVPHANPVMKLKSGTLLREPYGVIGIISPWNYPFNLPSIQTLTALATGNAVVLKPSEFTPYSSLELEKLLRAAGLDPGLAPGNHRRRRCRSSAALREYSESCFYRKRCHWQTRGAGRRSSVAARGAGAWRQRPDDRAGRCRH